jgi:hypothetical protein
MSTFLILKILCKDIDSEKFWWGFDPTKKHNLTLLTWNRICSTKTLGGLGIWSMEFQNSSLLAKLGWKLLTKENLLWVEALHSKHLKIHHFLAAPIDPTAPMALERYH